MQRSRPFLVRCPIFQNKCADTELVEELRNLFSLVIVRQASVASTRTDHHRGSIGFIRWCFVKGEARFIRVRISHCERRFPFPKWYRGQWLGKSYGGDGEKNGIHCCDSKRDR